jgi:hypothetical protein
MRSPARNASGSPSARIAMYCAVHGPIPGSDWRARVVTSGVATAVNATWPASTALASVRMASARDLITPTSSIGAVTNCAGVGKRRSTPSPASTTVPNRLARRPAMVVAAATDTCWPRMARTASSKPSHAPGVRRPGCRFRTGPSQGSLPRCFAMTLGWASRSNMRRTRSTITGRAREPGNRTSNSSADLAADRVIAIVPVLTPRAMVRW